MTFVVRVLFLSALAYTARAGILTGHHHADSFSSAALSAPSASYGTPSVSYGPPAHHFEHHHVSAPAHIDHHQQHISHASLPATGPTGLSATGPYNEGSLLLDETRPPTGSGQFSGAQFSSGSLQAASLQGGAPGGALVGTSTAVGAPRVIGSTVTVGRPITSATRYELQSVIQDIIRRVPVEVTRHIQVAVPVPQPVPVPQEVRVPVPQPYPVHVDVVKHVPYDVYRTQHVEVERPVPVEVIRHVPVEIIRKVPVPIERPYEVIKKVHVPIEKAVEVPVAVWKPYPIHIIKHVTHYKKKSCCW